MERSATRATTVVVRFGTRFEDSGRESLTGRDGMESQVAAGRLSVILVWPHEEALAALDVAL